MTVPAMTDEAKALVERLTFLCSLYGEHMNDSYGLIEFCKAGRKAIDLIETQAREIDHWGALVGDNARAACKVLDEKDAEIERLRDALGQIAPHVNWMPHPHCLTVEQIIRAALGDSHDQ